LIQPYPHPLSLSFEVETVADTKAKGSVTDYQRLNDITVKDRYPLPLITQLFENLKKSRYYTKMDLWWGFNNIRIKEGDEHKAAFAMPQGLFELTMMQFSLCNAPSTFQRMVDEILVGEVNTGRVQVYVNNILVHTDMVEKNRWLTQWEFKKEEVEFLGVMISYRKIAVSKDKTTAITREEPPKTRKGLRCFLSMTNYYWKFIWGYSEIAHPLHNLTKDILFCWT
jgi:hypothetical protein